MYATLDMYHTYGRRKEGYSEPQTIANLIIYNESVDHEREKKQILETYLSTVPHLIYYFVTFRDQEPELVVEKNMMYIKGEEGFIPGILDKTMCAMTYLHDNFSYTYLVRSNISTIILWNRFPWHEMKGLDYASTNVLRFIPDIPFAQGTNIILSRDAVSFVLENAPRLDRTIIDDVALAKLLLTRYPIYELHDRIRINQDRDENGWVYRNRTEGDRQADTDRMRHLLSSYDTKLELERTG